MDFQHITSVGRVPAVQISNIGCSADPKNNRFGPGKRDIWLIHYVTEGKGFFNGQPVTAGQGFLIYRGQSEYYYPDERNPWEFLWITLDDDNAKVFFEQYNIDKKTQIFNYDYVFFIKNIMHYIRNNNKRNLRPEEMLEIFLRIFNHQNKVDVKADSNADEYMNFALSYIRTHLHTQIKIREIADRIGISSTYLLCIFKNKLGVSPKQYISNLKLHISKKFLKESSLSITEISNSVGFCDVLTFSRFFSSKEGISPTGYRRLHGKQE